jgi:hypothetical protein
VVVLADRPLWRSVASAVLTAVLAVAYRSAMAAGTAVVFAVLAWLSTWPRTVLTPHAVTVARLFGRSERIEWTDVAALVRAGPSAVVVTVDGRCVSLPVVRWYAPGRDGRVRRDSVERVAAWAAAHGHPVPLRSDGRWGTDDPGALRQNRT